MKCKYYKINENLINKQFNIKYGSRYYGIQYQAIYNILLSLNFNVSSIGFKYWITAIINYRKNCFKYDNTIEKVYNDVARIHNTTRSKVERAMRTARKTATENINKFFNCSCKLSNKVVLELLTYSQRILIDNINNLIPRID